jgi:hypothetical protein
MKKKALREKRGRGSAALTAEDEVENDESTAPQQQQTAKRARSATPDASARTPQRPRSVTRGGAAFVTPAAFAPHFARPLTAPSAEPQQQPPLQAARPTPPHFFAALSFDAALETPRAQHDALLGAHAEPPLLGPRASLSSRLGAFSRLEEEQDALKQDALERAFVVGGCFTPGRASLGDSGLFNDSQEALSGPDVAGEDAAFDASSFLLFDDDEDDREGRLGSQQLFCAEDLSRESLPPAAQRLSFDQWR